MKGWSRRLLRYAAPQRGRLALLALFGVALIAFEALLPWPLKLIVDFVLPSKALPEPMAALARVLPGASTPSGLLGWLAGSILLLFLLVAALQLSKATLQADIAARLRFALASVVFDRLQSLSLIWHRRAQRGDLLKRVTADSGALSTLVLDILFPVAVSVVTLAVLFAVMWQLDRTMALIAAAAAVPMAVLMRLLAPRMSERSYLQQEADGAVWAGAEQALTAIPIVQGFGREADEESRFAGLTERSIVAYLRTLSSQLQFRIGIDASEAFGIAAIMIAGGYQVLVGAITVGTLVVFLSYVTALYAPLLSFAYLAMTAATAAGSAKRVAHILDADAMIDEIVGAPRLLRSTERGAEVRFDHVSFSYAWERPILDNVDLVVAPGETLALIGPSGAGKSTLVSLIPRLFDPIKGRVLIDGCDLRKVSIGSVRDSVALVLQESLLLPVSIADNIAYGTPTASREEIVAAACAASADAFIRELPQGYDTVVGERGATLSGGQRQRLSIARALLKDAPVLILDEPTSALDLATERDILDILASTSSRRTTIVVAHRLSTVRRADRIAVMDKGRIVAVGAHAELLATSSLYRLLYVSEMIQGTGGGPLARVA